MTVSPGREISINGRRYLPGAELPPMSEIIIRRLVENGDISRPAAEVKRPTFDERGRGRK
jgi:hypothetical protein